ncbi:hypothetical protein OE88DRAFT_1714869 [Heliocybe sulcata]|uniref:cystathionine gamma-lyase n=1 Tax=Heliocybe sulcata TaxID=5364 RepID=A0A5C3MR81_9AGAM|nr:hypothetical protein OE88DRAFT_1714869 [Heliocybe sulcata]
MGLDDVQKYSRSANLDRTALEEDITRISGDSLTLAFSSGPATAENVLQSLGLNAHIISNGCLWRDLTIHEETGRGESRLADTICRSAECAGEAAILAAFQDNTKPYWLDHILPIPSSFLTLLLHADAVICSLPKCAISHPDVNGCPDTEATPCIHGRLISASYSRGTKTLHVRVKAHGVNARQCLKHSPHVQEVIYSALTSHSKNDPAYRSLSPQARIFAMSLPGTARASRSLEELPAQMTHGGISPTERAALGIDDLVADDLQPGEAAVLDQVGSMPVRKCIIH